MEAGPRPCWGSEQDLRNVTRPPSIQLLPRAVQPSLASDDAPSSELANTFSLPLASCEHNHCHPGLSGPPAWRLQQLLLLRRVWELATAGTNQVCSTATDSVLRSRGFFQTLKTQAAGAWAGLLEDKRKRPGIGLGEGREEKRVGGSSLGARGRPASLYQSQYADGPKQLGQTHVKSPARAIGFAVDHLVPLRRPLLPF